MEDHIAIVQKAYSEAVKGIKDEWLIEEDVEWYNYVVSLPIPLQTTYMVVVLYNQVFNGGFHQYFANHYGQFAAKTIEALTRIKANKKAGLLKQALEFVNSDHDTDEIFRKRLMDNDLPSLDFKEDEEDAFDLLEELDDEYVELEEEELLELLAAYLERINS
jgi:hypothetical protein